MATLTGETRRRHSGLSEPLENILSHLGDQQPFEPACKAWGGSPWLARLNEQLPKTPRRPWNRYKRTRVES